MTTSNHNLRHPNDNEQPYPTPASSDHHHEQPLPPPHISLHQTPFHEFGGCQEILIYLTRLLLHLTRLNHHNATCPCLDDELPHPPTPNPTAHNDQLPATMAELTEYYRLRPPPPPQPSHHSQTDSAHYLEKKPTFRVYTKAKTDYSLTIRHGRVILAPTNPFDHNQHWIKDEKFGMGIKDEQGHTSFALVNKATGESMKYSIGVTYPVQLKKYNPNEVDMSVLWSEGKDFGDGYKPVRPVINIHLQLDAFKGTKKHGGVHDGTEVVLWKWNGGENQRWIIFPY